MSGFSIEMSGTGRKLITSLPAALSTIKNKVYVPPKQPILKPATIHTKVTTHGKITGGSRRKHRGKNRKTRKTRRT